MPLIVWKCVNNHEFEKLEQKAPADSETRTCKECGQPATQTVGQPAPFRWGIGGGWA